MSPRAGIVAFVVVVVVAAAVDAKSTPLGIQCHQCITRHPNWGVEKCNSAPVTCALGNFCTKANFGGSLTIRGCAPGGTEKEFVKESKMCKKTREYMTSTHVSNDLKKKFQEVVKVFDASCPPGNVIKNILKHKEPKKGFACKKKLCNGGERKEASLGLMAVAAVAALVTKMGAR